MSLRATGPGKPKNSDHRTGNCRRAVKKGSRALELYRLWYKRMVRNLSRNENPFVAYYINILKSLSTYE